jgi:hypothetical protein
MRRFFLRTQRKNHLNIFYPRICSVKPWFLCEIMQINIQIGHFSICAHRQIYMRHRLNTGCGAKHWDPNVRTFAWHIAFICAKLYGIGRKFTILLVHTHVDHKLLYLLCNTCTHTRTHKTRWAVATQPPAALPLIFMEPSAMDPNRGDVAPDESTSGPWQPGSCTLRRIPLFGAPKWNLSKNWERGGARVLGGCCLVQQPTERWRMQ